MLFAEAFSVGFGLTIGYHVANVVVGVVSDLLISFLEGLKSGYAKS